MKAISVIIPAYNAEDTLLEALQSVAEQTLPPNEVIVVDDMSTDSTVEVARKFCALRQGWKVISTQRNAGPAAARNLGVSNSSGEWIAFLDGDDAWLPERLEVQRLVLEKNPDAVMVCGKTISFDGGVKSEEQIATKRHRSHIKMDAQSRTAVQTRKAELLYPFCEIELKDLAVRNIVATSSVLVSKSLFEELGGFDSSFKGPEDYDLWMRIAASGRVLKADARISRYRDVEGSLSNDDRKFLPEVLKVLNKAYSKSGVLNGVAPKAKAVAYQYLSASWMAVHRGAIGRAVALYIKGCVLWPFSFMPQIETRLIRTKLGCYLLRNIFSHSHEKAQEA